MALQQKCLSKEYENLRYNNWCDLKDNLTLWEINMYDKSKYNGHNNNILHTYKSIIKINI